MCSTELKFYVVFDMHLLKIYSSPPTPPSPEKYPASLQCQSIGMNMTEYEKGAFHAKRQFAR